MHDESASDYCPASPDALDTSSLYHANSNIDDLTLALMNLSQVSSLESQQSICCCCGSIECQATKSWMDSKEKLEKRLHLSAEVGSALLQRHEAYVSRHESNVHTPRGASDDLAGDSLQDMHAEVDSPVAELMKDNAVLEKRLTQALLNSEVAEASHKTVLQELEEARTSVTRLTAYQARTVGIDSRLAATLQENDDLRQEQDSQAQKAKTAEARIAALKDRTDKLQAEVRRLQADLELRRLQRLESSESLLQDVRSRIEGLHYTRTSSAITEDSEVMKVLESLVSDNEVLKADNEELHKLLTESREDLQVLQSQVEENFNFAPPIRVDTPSRHSRTGSGPSSFIRDSLLNSVKRPSSSELKARRIFEPLTPETSHRPLSPAESMVPSETKYTSLHPQYPPSHFSSDVDEYDVDHHSLLTNPNQHSKAVQTDRWLGLHPTAQLTPSLSELVSSFPHDARSDSSSFHDSQPTHISALLERMMSLLLRMSQADALTLTNRLKRQHLRGADVKHLSRATVSSILSEITQLRAQYRVLLEDEKVTLMCTRKDLRGLFKFFKDVFEELGQLRVTLNDVILEPSIAQRVSEMALDPAKAEAMERERKASGPGSSWMAPFSKLFGSSISESNTHPSHSPPRPVSRGRGIIRQPRPVPKLGPALAASTTIVNVEFSGAGVGKSVTSTFSAHPTNEAHPFGPMSHVDTVPRPPAPTSNVRSVMGIFAGAPHPNDAADPWVVLPRAPRRVRSTFFKSDEPSKSGTVTIDRSLAYKRSNSHLSREIDVDTRLEHDEAADVPGPLIERALRRRGLSDSSIHSTYMNQTQHSTPAELSTGGSVLQTLSRTMRNFSFAASQTVSGSVASPPPPSRVPEEDAGPREGLDVPRSHPRRVATPTLSSLIPNLGLTSWATASAALENPHSGPRAMYYGSVREDSIMPRSWGREDQRRDV
ncbi:hypothetical protein DEU56DRAFT_231457 [Suillus clintonianus]|uniref:uncharacterized protein n=1 Tax=Suillus clintonianus TaxID=1904413 RepID=UPI001B86BE01|nr:uncharacterized protein DEU56DRAFT_231457 [Suillus clintonianus]KAG2156347.1 hypothetical protein DEU56DRAFT_231457 [Suillus clintonianus]